MHKVFDEIDNDYVTNEVCNYHDFFNANHVRQG